jgi:hypothetical protein
MGHVTTIPNMMPDSLTNITLFSDVIIPHSNLVSLPLQVLGHQFKNQAQLFEFLRQQATIKGDGAIELVVAQATAELLDLHRAREHGDQSFLTDYLDLIQEICPAAVKAEWWKDNDLEDGYKRLRQIRKVEKSRRQRRETRRMGLIETQWGPAGAHILEQGSNSTKVQYLNALVKIHGQWEDAQHFLNRAIYERLMNWKRGRPKHTRLTTPDAQYARDLATEGAQPPELTQAEIQQLSSKTGVNYGYDQFGLLTVEINHPTPGSPIFVTPEVPGYAETIYDSPRRPLNNPKHIQVLATADSVASEADGDQAVTTEGDSDVEMAEGYSTSQPPAEKQQTTSQAPSNTLAVPDADRDQVVITQGDSGAGVAGGQSTSQPPAEKQPTTSQAPANKLAVPDADGDQAVTTEEDSDVEMAEGYSTSQPPAEKQQTTSQAPANKLAVPDADRDQVVITQGDSGAGVAGGQSTSQPPAKKQTNTATKKFRRHSQQNCNCDLLSAAQMKAISDLAPYHKTEKDAQIKAIKLVDGISDTLETMAESTRGRRMKLMCPRHMKALTSALNMVTKGVSHITLTERLAIAACHASDEGQWQVRNLDHPHRAKWFRHGRPKKHIIPQSIIHPFRSTFDPDQELDDPEDLYSVPATRAELDHILNDILFRLRSDVDDPVTSTTFTNTGLHEFNSLFSWWNDGKIPLSHLAKVEFQVFEHHLKTKYKAQNSKDATRIYFQYSLTQQLMRMDPVLFILVHCLRPCFMNKDEAHIDPRIIAIPMPAIHAHSDTHHAPMAMHDPTVKNEDTYRPPVYGVIPVVPNKFPMEYLAFPFGTSPDVATEFSKEYSKYDDEPFTSLSSLPVGIDLEVANQLHLTNPEKFPLKIGRIPEGGIAIWDGCIPMAPYWIPEGHVMHSLLAYQLCFVHPEYDEMYSATNLHAARQNLCPLDFFPPPQKGTIMPVPNYNRLPFQKILVGPDPLGRAMSSQADWDVDSSAIAAILLGPDRNAAWNYILHWREIARAIVLKEFGKAQMLDDVYYDKRSYSNMCGGGDAGESEDETVGRPGFIESDTEQENDDEDEENDDEDEENDDEDEENDDEDEDNGDEDEEIEDYEPYDDDE